VYAGGPTEKTIEELDSAAHLKSRAVYVFFLPYADHLTRNFIVFFSGTPPAGEAPGTLRLMSQSTLKAGLK
jgi:hypothetical protein